MDIYGIIMAGGSGTRMWPLSRQHRPKQFIGINGKEPFVIQALQRLECFIPADNIYLITNRSHERIASSMLKGYIPLPNIIFEPAAKNTAACITYASLLLKQKYSNGILCFVPSDSLITDFSSYAQVLEKACRLAKESDSLVVIGVKPLFPSTGYGYIKAADCQLHGDTQIPDTFAVECFVEKPEFDKVVEFFKSEQYYWNSGILVGRIDIILDSLSRHLPEIPDMLLEALGNSEGNISSSKALDNAYSNIQSISIDHGMLEKCSNLLMVRGDFDWCDIGCLNMLDKLLEEDTNGNAVAGRHMGLGTGNCIIYGDRKLTVTCGLHDMIVINNDDVTLVYPRNNPPEMSVLLSALKNKGYQEYL